MSYLIKVAVRHVDVLRLTDPDPDGAEGGALQGLHGDVQRGPGELSVIDKHHPVPGDNASVLRKTFIITSINILGNCWFILMQHFIVISPDRTIIQSKHNTGFYISGKN